MNQETTITIPASETPYIEFKSEFVKAIDLAEEMIAFANAEGGEIWIGLNDDGTINGISRSYEEDIMNISRTACIPPLTVTYKDLKAGEYTVARIIVPKGKDKPYYSSRQKYYIRVGTTKRVASREELLRLFQVSGAIHYDIVEIDRAKQSDLDVSHVASYFSRYQLDFIDEPEPERLRLMANTDILGDAGNPTLAGLLIFGIAPERFIPSSGIALAHFSGNEITEDLIDKQNIFGPLPRQVEGAIAAIKSNMVVGSRISGLKREEAAHYPDKVFRELVTNACVHRNYSISGSNIRIFIFSNRIEFISPGPLPNTVTIEKLPVGVSFARNPTLVRFMENLGYVDKLGRGLPMVCQEAKKLNRQVHFQEIGQDFKVILSLQ